MDDLRDDDVFERVFQDDHSWSQSTRQTPQSSATSMPRVDMSVHLGAGGPPSREHAPTVRDAGDKPHLGTNENDPSRLFGAASSSRGRKRSSSVETAAQQIRPVERHRDRRSASPGAAQYSQDSQEERRERREKRRQKRERREARYEAKKEAKRRHERGRGRRSGSASASPRPSLASSRPSSRKSSHLPNPGRFGLDPHDLFAAERAERAETEKKDWATKLGSLLDDDLAGGWNEFGSSSRGGVGGAGWSEDAAWEAEMRRMRGEDEEGADVSMEDEQVQIPKRWRDAAQNQRQVRTDLMDEEEYAEYIRDGMWRRAHAADVAAQEAAAERAKKQKAEQEARRAKQAQEKVEAAYKRQGVELDEARSRWERAWFRLGSSAPSAETQDLKYQDIPWPVLRESGRALDFSLEGLRRFLLEITPADRAQAREALSAATASSKPQSDAEPGRQLASARLRTALRRYHPDRFFSSTIYRRVVEEDRERVRKVVERVAQGLSELIGQRRD